MRKALLVFLCLAWAPTAAFGQDEQMVQRLADRFAEALNKGDAALAADFYTEDALVLPPGTEMIRGREAIQSFWQEGLATIEDITLTTVNVEPLGGDALLEIGEFRFTAKGEQPQQVNGKYVVVLRKQGDEWKIASDIWNMNQ